MKCRDILIDKTKIIKNLLKRISENISESIVRTEIGKIIESSFEITKGVIDSEKFNILFDKKNIIYLYRTH
jgi:hypothetical protein